MMDTLLQQAAVLAEMPDVPHFTVDAEKNVVDLSPAMERLTGFDRSEVVGRSCLLLHRCEECLSGCGVFDNGYYNGKGDTRPNVVTGSTQFHHLR